MTSAFLGHRITPKGKIVSNKFYLDVVTFEVEQTVYKVLRKPFEEKSVVFKGMFSTRRKNRLEGLLDEQPIVLEGVKQYGWELLLGMLLEPDKKSTPQKRSLEDWTSVLELSRRWIMNEVHKAACEQIESSKFLADPIRKITYAREHSRSQWLKEGFVQLVTRDKTFTLVAAGLCDMPPLLRLFELRESYHRRSGPLQCTSMTDERVTEGVVSIFKQEIAFLDTSHDLIFNA